MIPRIWLLLAALALHNHAALAATVNVGDLLLVTSVNSTTTSVLPFQIVQLNGGSSGTVFGSSVFNTFNPFPFNGAAQPLLSTGSSVFNPFPFNGATAPLLPTGGTVFNLFPLSGANVSLVTTNGGTVTPLLVQGTGATFFSNTGTPFFGFTVNSGATPTTVVPSVLGGVVNIGTLTGAAAPARPAAGSPTTTITVVPNTLGGFVNIGTLTGASAPARPATGTTSVVSTTGSPVSFTGVIVPTTQSSQLTLNNGMSLLDPPPAASTSNTSALVLSSLSPSSGLSNGTNGALIQNPEPSSLLLLGSGLAGLRWLTRKRGRRHFD